MVFGISVQLVFNYHMRIVAHAEHAPIPPIDPHANK
jgi:hypothetical protein